MEITELQLYTALLDAYGEGIEACQQIMEKRKPAKLSDTINEIIDNIKNEQK